MYSVPPFHFKRFPVLAFMIIATVRGFLLNFGVYSAARAAMGLSFQWSPTITACLAPDTSEMRHSGSVACVLSSMSTCLKRKLVSRGSPDPTHVAQMTSAACSTSRYAARSCAR